MSAMGEKPMLLEEKSSDWLQIGVAAFMYKK